MEIVKEINELQINLMDINYKKSSKILSVKILNFMFVSRYNKNERVNKLLDDIHKTLKLPSLNRDQIYIMNITANSKIREEKTINFLLKLQKNPFIDGASVNGPQKKDDDKKTIEKHEDTIKKNETKIDIKYYNKILATLKQTLKTFADTFEKNESKIQLKKGQAKEAMKNGDKDRARALLIECKKLTSQNEKLSDMINKLERKMDALEEGDKLEVVSEAALKIDEQLGDLKGKDVERIESISDAGEILSDVSIEDDYDVEDDLTDLETSILISSDIKEKNSDESEYKSRARIKDELEQLKRELSEEPSSKEKKELISLQKTDVTPETAKMVKPIEYNINMGMQYYSVMMEQKSYLFYIYLSHEELKIVDEEGKVVYTTTVKIVTTKKEPPKLYIRVKGDGFEVHPFDGNVVVNKGAVNPPIMIFSILPLKLNKKKGKGKKFESEKRTLNVLIDFEGKTISHTMLSVIVQPKHFHLDIGPVHINVGKNTAFAISFLSVLIATISVIYSFFTLKTDSTAFDILSLFAPGIASSLFFVVFVISIIKGVYPLKKKWSGLLNFDKTTGFMK